jgi:hypothetical protein
VHALSQAHERGIHAASAPANHARFDEWREVRPPTLNPPKYWIKDPSPDVVAYQDYGQLITAKTTIAPNHIRREPRWLLRLRYKGRKAIGWTIRVCA